MTDQGHQPDETRSDRSGDHPGTGLIACPQCDAVYRMQVVARAQRASCTRCHTVLVAPRRDAGLVIIALASASMVLVIAALTQPFLEIRRLGFWSEASLIDFALAFSSGMVVPLTLAMLAFIIGIPMMRLGLTLYAIAPLVFDRAPLAGAKAAFRLNQRLKPWSMAEIFVLGCVVSLTKLTDLARVEVGPAFWMFVVLVVLMLIQDRIQCRWSVWAALNR